ncbi:MAG: hypothetical protein HDR37_11200 [Treponema sp.]|nr:hypothetical protein [Treponema sp.]
MKKICKSMAIFAIMAGLVCMASYAKSLSGVLGSKLKQEMGISGRGDRVVILDGRNNKAPYDSIDLKDNGRLEASKPNSMEKVKGKWETSGSKNAVKNGDTITVTIDDKTVKGTVRQISSKFVKGDPKSYDSAKPKEDRTITTYSVNLGALGTYTYTEEQYLSDK